MYMYALSFPLVISKECHTSTCILFYCVEIHVHITSGFKKEETYVNLLSLFPTATYRNDTQRPVYTGDFCCTNSMRFS